MTPEFEWQHFYMLNLVVMFQDKGRLIWMQPRSQGPLSTSSSK